MGGTLITVSGGQFGSEAKGHVSELLLDPLAVGTMAVGVRVGGPNAGHIVYGELCPPWCGTEEGQSVWGWEPEEDHHYMGDVRGQRMGHPWKLRQVPVAAVANPSALLVIAAGSEVHEPTLNEEVVALEAAGYPVRHRLVVDRSATVLTQRHVEQEKHHDLNARLGSTAKGIGAARADRLWRTASVYGDLRREMESADTAALMRERLAQGWTVLIEGTQGYGLGLHTKQYPMTTSGGCRAIDFLAQAGLSPWDSRVDRFEPWLAVRVRPIRVAGNSGPMKNETTWEQLGLREERTTVTKKVRRVGEWDAELVREAIEANGGTDQVRLALTMVDTVVPELARSSGWPRDPEVSKRLATYLAGIEGDLDGCRVRWVGTGPDTGLWVPGSPSAAPGGMPMF